MIVEDEPAVARGVQVALEREGYDVSVQPTGEDAIANFADAAPDLVVLDVRLPGIDGFEVLRQLRRDTRAPVLFLTARADEVDKVVGLEMGADDYLVKPFSTAELVARVRALLRRRRDLTSVTSTRYADLVLDHATREVRRGTRPVVLTRREFDLLALFMANPEVAMPRARLVAEAWGGEPVLPGPASVDVYVGYLRRKLEERGEPRLLHTVRGVGYQLRMPPDPASR